MKPTLAIGLTILSSLTHAVIDPHENHAAWAFDLDHSSAVPRVRRGQSCGNEIEKGGAHNGGLCYLDVSLLCPHASYFPIIWWESLANEPCHRLKAVASAERIAAQPAACPRTITAAPRKCT